MTKKPAAPAKSTRTTGNKAKQPASHRGQGDELQQMVEGKHATLTTNQGTPLSDNQNSLKATPRGPTLLEDFILREKITHFDHERIPERIVHARGSGAHGTFTLTKSLKQYTTAKILTEVGEKTPLFTRISTVAGGSGSVDTPRDVRDPALTARLAESFAEDLRDARPITLEEIDDWSAFERARNSLSLLLREQL